MHVDSYIEMNVLITCKYRNKKIMIKNNKMESEHSFI